MGGAYCCKRKDLDSIDISEIGNDIPKKPKINPLNTNSYPKEEISNHENNLNSTQQTKKITNNKKNQNEGQNEFQKKNEKVKNEEKKPILKSGNPITPTDSDLHSDNNLPEKPPLYLTEEKGENKTFNHEKDINKYILNKTEPIENLKNINLKTKKTQIQDNKIESEIPIPVSEDNKGLKQQTSTLGILNNEKNKEIYGKKIKLNPENVIEQGNITKIVESSNDIYINNQQENINTIKDENNEYNENKIFMEPQKQFSSIEDIQNPENVAPDTQIISQENPENISTEYFRINQNIENPAPVESQNNAENISTEYAKNNKDVFNDIDTKALENKENISHDTGINNQDNIQSIYNEYFKTNINQEYIPPHMPIKADEKANILTNDNLKIDTSLGNISSYNEAISQNNIENISTDNFIPNQNDEKLSINTMVKSQENHEINNIREDSDFYNNIYKINLEQIEGTKTTKTEDNLGNIKIESKKSEVNNIIDIKDLTEPFNSTHINNFISSTSVKSPEKTDNIDIKIPINKLTPSKEIYNLTEFQDLPLTNTDNKFKQEIRTESSGDINIKNDLKELSGIKTKTMERQPTTESTNIVPKEFLSIIEENDDINSNIQTNSITRTIDIKIPFSKLTPSKEIYNLTEFQDLPLTNTDNELKQVIRTESSGDINIKNNLKELSLSKTNTMERQPTTKSTNIDLKEFSSNIEENDDINSNKQTNSITRTQPTNLKYGLKHSTSLTQTALDLNDLDKYGIDINDYNIPELQIKETNIESRSINNISTEDINKYSKHGKTQSNNNLINLQESDIYDSNSPSNIFESSNKNVRSTEINSFSKYVIKGSGKTASETTPIILEETGENNDANKNENINKVEQNLSTKTSKLKNSNIISNDFNSTDSNTSSVSSMIQNKIFQHTYKPYIYYVKAIEAKKRKRKHRVSNFY